MDTRELLDQGWIHARVIIEVLGKPKEHVERSIQMYVEKIKEDTNFKVINEDIASAESKDDMFATFVELDMFAKDISMLIGFCFDYMPSSVEIVEPENLKLSMSNISDLYNDLLAKLHNIDMVAKQLTSENLFLKKNINALIQNLLFYIILSGPKTIKVIARLAGIPEKEVEIYIEKMIKLGKVKKEDDKILWNKDGNKE